VVLETFPHTPVGNEHEQRCAVVTAEHAGEAGQVDLDALQDLPTLTDPHDAGCVVVHGRAPDGAFGVHADPVTGPIGPRAAVREAAVGGDVESREPAGERL